VRYSQLFRTVAIKFGLPSYAKAEAWRESLIKWCKSQLCVEAPAMSKKKRKRLHGTVERVIEPAFPGETEKAQIGIEEADHLYREIRVENVLTDEDGDKVKLKPGAEVDVVVEADTDATLKQSS
jgi:hypothetical protein